jgi:hypothetical protein
MAVPNGPAGPHDGEPTAERWSNRAVGGATMPILITAILLFLALLIIAGPMLEDIIDKIWPPDGRTAQRPR